RFQVRNGSVSVHSARRGSLLQAVHSQEHAHDCRPALAHCRIRSDARRSREHSEQGRSCNRRQLRESAAAARRRDDADDGARATPHPPSEARCREAQEDVGGAAAAAADHAHHLRLSCKPRPLPSYCRYRSIIPRVSLDLP
ncbi:hypothetical protein PMAYCL1PPCAC_14273, partial [Pristionchus mayeri]